MRSSIVAGVLLCVATTGAVAQTADDVRKFDRNKNGRIDKGAELDAFWAHRFGPFAALYQKYDKNFDGKLDATELAAMREDQKKARLTGASGAALDELLLDLGNRPGFPIEELAQKGDAATDKSKKKEDGPIWFIRKNKPDISVAQNPIVIPVAQGASVSYSHNGIAKEDIWSVDGVAAVAFVRNSAIDNFDRNGMNLTGYAVMPWLEVHRLSSSKVGAKQTDKATVGTDAEFEFSGILGAQYLTLGADYQTDRIAKAQIFDGTLKWQPFNDQLKLGTWYAIVPNLQFTWLMALEANYRTVQDVGTNVNLTNTDYFWAGGWAKAIVRYLLDEKRAVVLTTQYDYRHDFKSDRDAQLLTVSLAVPVDANGNVSASVDYKRGKDWTTLDKFDLITVGLNFKF